MFWDNLGLTLKSDLLPFFFACTEARDPISLVFVSLDMFNTLKGLAMVYKPTVTLQLYWFLWSLMYLGETMRYYILKSY